MDPLSLTSSSPLSWGTSSCSTILGVIGAVVSKSVVYEDGTLLEGTDESLLECRTLELTVPEGSEPTPLASFLSWGSTPGGS